MKHKWKGTQLGGSPDEAASYEWISVCDNCGDEQSAENTDEQCEAGQREVAKQAAFDAVKDGHFGCFQLGPGCGYDHEKIFKGGFNAGWQARDDETS